MLKRDLYNSLYFPMSMVRVRVRVRECESAIQLLITLCQSYYIVLLPSGLLLKY